MPNREFMIQKIRNMISWAKVTKNNDQLERAAKLMLKHGITKEDLRGDRE